MPREALAGLFEWARTHLGMALDAPAALADDAIDRAMLGSVLMRGRQRIAGLAGRLQSRVALPGWHLEPLRWPTDNLGEVVARGPDGARVDVRFTLGARGNRSQVGVDFRIADESDPRSVKAVINELVVLLRGPQPASGASTSAAAPGIQ